MFDDSDRLTFFFNPVIRLIVNLLPNKFVSAENSDTVLLFNANYSVKSGPKSMPLQNHQ